MSEAGGAQAIAAASRRRRLTLAPGRTPASTDVISLVGGCDGSRFRSLVCVWPEVPRWDHGEALSQDAG
jgi:hypothetical protein